MSVGCKRACGGGGNHSLQTAGVFRRQPPVQSLLARCTLRLAPQVCLARHRCEPLLAAPLSLSTCRCCSPLATPGAADQRQVRAAAGGGGGEEGVLPAAVRMPWFGSYRLFCVVRCVCVLALVALARSQAGSLPG